MHRFKQDDESEQKVGAVVMQPYESGYLEIATRGRAGYHLQIVMREGLDLEQLLHRYSDVFEIDGTEQQKIAEISASDVSRFNVHTTKRSRDRSRHASHSVP